MERIYFDNAATTPLSPEAKAAITDALELYGNPSSLHSLGVEAEKRVSEARQAIFAALGIRSVTKLLERSLIFTASGTEADNLALIGTATAKSFPAGKKIIISDSEHPAVLSAAAALEARGFKVIRIPTVKGVPDYYMIEDVADKDTILASFMLVNNETGAVYDIPRISRAVRSKNPNALIHTDCVQAFMNIKFTPKALGADMVSISAHKIGGPKGVGALYVAPEILVKKQLSPIIFGGGQEFGMRSGTENLLGIIGFGAAVKGAMAKFDSLDGAKTEVYDYLVGSLSDSARFPEVRLNIPKNHVNSIISLTLPNIRSETMLHCLSREGIFVSSGSACASNTGSKSHVLKAYGLTDREVDSTLRISIGGHNTKAEADILLAALEKNLKTLIRTTN